MTRRYRFRYLPWCATCGRHAREAGAHAGHDLWFSETRRESALFEALVRMAVVSELFARMAEASG